MQRIELLTDHGGLSCSSCHFPFTKQLESGESVGIEAILSVVATLVN
jgi:hypothetical protein